MCPASASTHHMHAAACSHVWSHATWEGVLRYSWWWMTYAPCMRGFSITARMQRHAAAVAIVVEACNHTWGQWDLPAFFRASLWWMMCVPCMRGCGVMRPGREGFTECFCKRHHACTMHVGFASSLHMHAAARLQRALVQPRWLRACACVRSVGTATDGCAYQGRPSQRFVRSCMRSIVRHGGGKDDRAQVA